LIVILGPHVVRHKHHTKSHLNYYYFEMLQNCVHSQALVLCHYPKFKDGYTWKYWTCLQKMTMMNINTKMMSSGHMAFEVSCSVRAALCAMPGSRYTAPYPYVNTNGCKCGVCERECVRVQYTCTCLICLLIFVHVILFPLHTVSSVKTREASLGLLPRDA